MERKFGFLKFIGSVYRIAGIIIGVLTILSALASCLMPVLGAASVEQVGEELGLAVASGALAGVFLGALVLIFGGLLAVTLYATGQGIFLFLAIEENTRATALYLQSYAEE